MRVKKLKEALEQYPDDAFVSAWDDGAIYIESATETEKVEWPMGFGRPTLLVERRKPLGRFDTTIVEEE